MALAAESTLGSALEAVDITLKDDDVLYAKHILDAERHRERAQAMARAEHQARSVENAYKRSVHDAMVQYERECAQLKKTMVDDILAELKLLRDNRDGVSLVRKGLARSARSTGTLSILFAASAMGVVYALMLARSVHEPIFLIHVGASALIAGVCAGLTPTSFDAAVLLVQVVAFSMAVLNSRFCSGRPNTNCFLLLDSATAMSIVFVPMAVLRMHQHAHVVSAAICLDLVGLLYIPITFRMLMSELGYTPSGQEIAMRYLFIVWGCDTGAYVTGKLLTKRKYKFSRRSKLAPLISPKKDVEGTVGGVALAVAASCVANAGFVVDRQRACWIEWTGLSSCRPSWPFFTAHMFPSLYEFDKKYKIANDMVFLSNKDQLWLLEAISRGLAKSP
ncbi:hypothetical protein DYB36_001878 [Aphanomyces astaci]|uniref:Uncharacterized protein n=1 Tax=Aphanomyces astaci TaxID=112090 RepID=A0A397AX70_APHAT|nr:hypothetical protein DYB36_001878 [Aphanomyces astaci]